jgi:alpha-beta hydrolase superfamily lysophospholipase
MTPARGPAAAWLAAVLLVPLALLASPLGVFFAAPLVTALQHRDHPHGLPFDKGAGPGSVVAAHSMPELTWKLRLLQVRAARVEYRSTGEHGQRTVVSGAVFTPPGRAPAGGWPVIALAHATTGIERDCAPSLDPNLLGSAGAVFTYVRAGYAVALPDYQGLGARGVHPYLDSAVAGRNLIDAVRALRAVFDDVSTRWLAAGVSQGGGAAWSANEQADTYGAGLDLVGSVSVSPAADMTSLVTKAETGAMVPEERGVLQWFLASTARLDPHFELDDYRSTRLAAQWSVLSTCDRAHAAARIKALAQIGPADLRPRTVEAAARLRDRLQELALPRRRATAPMLVVYGSADQLVDPASTTAAIARARALGDRVTADLQPGRGHLDVDVTGIESWIRQRFG